MTQPDTDKMDSIAESLVEYRGRLLNLARRNLNPILSRRVTPEDVVQDTLSAACQKVAFLENNPEIPVYFKLRKILFQTIAALERKHLQSQKRDAYKELEAAGPSGVTAAGLDWEMFADSVTGPLSRAERVDRYELLKKAMAGLQESDRQILELRHFDDMSNAECAEVLHVTAKNASIRYVRALERLQRLLIELTEFRP